MPHRSPRSRRRALASLPSKVLLFVLAAGALRVLVLGGVALELGADMLRGLLREALTPLAERTALALDATLAGARAEMAQVALDLSAAALPPPGTAPLGPDEPLPALEPSRFRGQLERALARAPSLAGLALVDPGGAVVAAAGAPPTRSDRERLERAGLDAPGVAVRREGGAPRLIVSTPIQDGGGHRIASLHGRIAADRARALLPGSGIPGIAGTHLVLAAPGGGGPAAGDGLPAALAGGPEPPWTRDIEGPGGAALVAAAAPLETLDGHLVVAADPRALAGIARSVIAWIFSIDLLGFLLFAAIAYRTAARTLRPLEELSEGARRISRGELDAVVPDTGGDDEVSLLTRTFNAMTRKLQQHRSEIAQANRQLTEQNQELQQANEVLAQLSITDGLTKLHNHRYFQDHLTREIKRVSRAGEPLAMLLVDIDDFKSLNDRLGHAAGDELLVRIARLMNASVRESDLIARYGGEEFVILGAGTDLEGAVHLAEKIRTAVAEQVFVLEDAAEPLRVTVSIGVAQLKRDRKSFFIEADRALYRAKAEGKNCVMVAGDGAGPSF